MSLPSHVRVAVIGSGFAGLGTAVRLRQEGIEDFALLERGAGVGGTWRDNTYPGCACHVPSHLYSFSFAPNPGWSHTFSRQPEIHAYLEAVARDQGVLPHCRFGVELEAADWDEDAGVWRLRTSAGDLTASVVVAGCGGLAEPRLPDVPGLESFAGTAFHSARWDHAAPLEGKRIVVVGTGASAIQFVPHLQKQAAHLTVFQRTPPWILPRVDRAFGEGERAAYRRAPLLQQAARGGIYAVRELHLLAFTGRGRLRALAQNLAGKHLAASVPDPDLRAILTPDYEMGCKRVLLSNDYYPAVAAPNVRVVPHGVQRVLPQGVVAADGTVHEADVIVFGTGFQVMDIPVAHRITGRTGQTLADHWGDSPKAHRGSTVAGFPNLFVLLGPNTALGHSSVVLMIEGQIAYVMAALRAMERLKARSVEVRGAVQDAYDARLQEGLSTTVWAQGGCKAWYTNDSGRNFTLWPTHTWTFRSLTSRFDAESYEVLAEPSARHLEPV
jgi:cation diffusion facilitator CzcD-associated flavoprotein CzcO